jgi:DNA-binding NtrC family response regulator
MPKSILVVDDEHALADTLCAILERAGYNARAVYSADRALEILHTGGIDLLISDVVMPGMNGVELAARASQNDPHIGILLISGNAATQQIVTDHLGHGRFQLLAKPVLPKQMLAHVEWLLAQSKQP